MKKLAENIFWIVPALLVPVVIAAVFLLQQKYEGGTDEPDGPNPLEVASDTEKKNESKTTSDSNQKQPEASPLNSEKTKPDPPKDSLAKPKSSEPKPGNVAQPAEEKEKAKSQPSTKGGPIIAEAKSAVSTSKEKPGQPAEAIRKDVKLPQEGNGDSTVPELPESTKPKPVAEPVQPAEPKKSEEIEYVVRSGDNPWTIAQAHGVKMEDILALNKIENPRNLKIGQVLKIPPRATGNTSKPAEKPVAKAPPQPAAGDGYEFYTIKSGENPWTIAKKLKVNHQEILDLNKDLDFRQLQIGQQIKVPKK